MSGTTTQLGDIQTLSGFGSVAIDGTLYNVSDVTFSPTYMEWESQMGYNGFHGYKGTYIPAFIAFKVRDSANIRVSDFLNMLASEVTVSMANGKTVSGQPMRCMKAVEVDANEGQFDVRFEGPQVTGS